MTEDNIQYSNPEVANMETIIKAALHESTCKVIFTKANGEERTMICTLNPASIPASVDANTTRTKKENPDVQPVYDTESQGWRSFRWDSIKTFEGNYTQ